MRGKKKSWTKNNVYCGCVSSIQTCAPICTNNVLYVRVVHKVTATRGTSSVCKVHHSVFTWTSQLGRMFGAWSRCDSMGVSGAAIECFRILNGFKRDSESVMYFLLCSFFIDGNIKLYYMCILLALRDWGQKKITPKIIAVFGWFETFLHFSRDFFNYLLGILRTYLIK